MNGQQNGELRLFDDAFESNITAEPSTFAEPDEADEPGDRDDDFSVIVERSARRRRTVGAQMVGGVLKVVVPSWMSRAEEDHWVDVMTGRFRRKMSTDRIDLGDRSLSLARRHDLSRPREIKWSDDMRSRWGSCTPGTGTIRISSRIAKFPDWVIDYVIVHELAHLEVGDHSDAFWRIVHRYPKAERAIGYLIAKSGDDGDSEDRAGSG
ncbi:MAG: putative metal-dependent hydrolase [Acidimicrobiales bacterium]|nr:putative metal-dependent hydrolase [Acidimicrobiales bacterium]